MASRAWGLGAYTVFDVIAANALFALAAYFVFQSPTLPVLVWSISVFVFTAIALGGAIWSWRDALAASADSTADFVAALRLRLDRRERVPRFVLRLAAAEMGFGLAFYAIWSPEWLGRAARIYGAIALVLAAWWRGIAAGSVQARPARCAVPRARAGCGPTGRRRCGSRVSLSPYAPLLLGGADQEPSCCEPLRRPVR